ncbi:MAG TPA: hypothetical protein VGT98_06775, partial [Candidatus Elarobacter sp.]|nr:hypothetical protein [Candidatus Elarobacter sp.]
MWTFEIKVGGRRALAYERGDRGDVVFVRWTDLTKTGRERRRKRSLDLVVRDERGALDSVLIAKAEAAVIAFFNSIATPADIAPEPAEPLTLAEGIALAFASNGPTPTLSLKK